MVVLLFLAFASIFNGYMIVHGLEFVVSPEPVSFTVHPRSDIALEGTNVTLHCAARIVNIGGFQRPREKDTVPWSQYEIYWEFMPTGYTRGVGFPEAKMHFAAAAKDNMQIENFRATEDTNVNSTLTIDGSRLSDSGAYRCIVKDWHLKYTSYHGFVQIIPRETASYREITVAPSLAAVSFSCSNQLGGNWWSQYQTVNWAAVGNGESIVNIRNSMSYTMSNGDLVLYGGFPLDGVNLVCDRQWSNAIGLPVANESHTLRIHVLETGEHDNTTEDVVTTWLGDKVDILCNLPLWDNDTVVWYHGDSRLASDGSSGATADPSGTILQFEAQSASYQGWYTCVVRENERHSTRLIIRGRRDLSGGASVVAPQGHTHFIGAGDATKVLDCNTPEDPEEKVLQYEWTVNGVHANSSTTSLSANRTGVYICYTHLREQTLTAIHRVLPYGYINPVTKLEYPRAEVVGGTALDPIVRFHFSWQPPEVLGGLTRDGIQYRVRLMTERGETVADDVNQDLFFERNFSGFHNITTRMNITVSAESRHSSPSPSLPTVIPFAAVLEWYRYDIKVYCNSTQLDFHLKNPLYNLLKSHNIGYYGARLVGNYFLIGRRNGSVTEDYLQEHGRLTKFQHTRRFGYRLPGDDDKYIELRNSLWDRDIGNVAKGTVRKGGYSSVAVAFFPAFSTHEFDKSFYLRHFQQYDYYICNFEDLPQISFAMNYIEIAGTVDAYTVYLQLSKPSNTRFLAQVVHNNLSLDVWVESKQVEIPFSFTPTYGRVEYALTVNEEYDNVATVGKNSTLLVNFTLPQSTSTESTSLDTAVLTMVMPVGSVAVLAIITIPTIGLCICCLFACSRRKVLLANKARELEMTEIKNNSSKQLFLVTFDDSPADDVTQYDICSNCSVDFSGTSTKSEEASVSLQLTANSCHMDSSSDYTFMGAGGMVDGYYHLPMEYAWDKSVLAHDPPSVDAQSCSDDVQFPHTNVAAYITTAAACTGNRTVSSSATSGATTTNCQFIVPTEKSVKTSRE